MAAYLPPPPPFPFFAYPIITYSITYDIFTLRPMSGTALKAGIRREAIYTAGLKSRSSPLVMLALEGIIMPPNKLSSTVKGLRMSKLDHFALMDVTPIVGGAAVLSLRGPVPAGLVQAPAALVPPAVPIPAGFPFARPVESRPGPGANNPATFLM
ncbi:hypothetical protein DFH07DRAFT_964404 [Mycena maculata]|uniref:Uncharacterized protein n=1 Tax=Mycena maculata TaxID=230809 RepID=A0AAD7IGN6_9AGAR|nr:hypothetical protein DFH07DRAFT_964404 [Mycena maculata]